MAGAAVLRDEITTNLREAVVQELATVGYGRMSIEGVARRAGVGKAAIYRRWSSKPELVLDVVSAVAEQRLPLPDTGSLVGDLEVALHILARALSHPLASQIIPDLLAEAARNPPISQTLRRVLHAYQRDIAVGLIDRAVARGELPAGVEPDLMIDLVVGPLYWHLAIARTPIRDDHLSQLASATAAALAAAAAVPSRRVTPA